MGHFATHMGHFETHMGHFATHIYGTFCNDRGAFATISDLLSFCNPAFYAAIMRKYAERRQLCKNMQFQPKYAISCGKIKNMRFHAENPKICGIACTAFK